MIRKFKPKRIIEIGGGISTHYAIQAISQNQNENNKFCELTCIEPYPFDELRKCRDKINLIEKKIQDVEMSTFEKLDEGDFLFIDSSHVGKIGSDVNHIMLNIVPSLPQKSYIHFHDMYLPYTTTPEDHKVFNASCIWNEILIVSSFLNFNKEYKVIQSQSIMHHRDPEKFNKSFPSYNPKINFPSSMWVYKE